MADFVKVATKADLNPGEGMRVKIQDKDIALFNVEGEYYAMDLYCPHAGAPLSDGYLEEDTVLCPWHGWEFNVKTGECPTGMIQQTFPVKVEGDDILIGFPAETQSL